jgi:tetratricopeptide (TPR) repeat protein
MAEDLMFQEALDAVRLRQRNRARDLFTRLLRIDQKNVDYWLYMSTVVDSIKERVFCLQKALRLDPENEAVRRGLILAGAMTPSEDFTPVKPVRQRTWDVPTILRGSGDPQAIRSSSNSPPPSRILAVVGVGLILVVLLFVGLVGNPLAPETPIARSDRPTSTPKPLITSGPSATYLPTETSEFDLTPSATFFGPTPLWVILEATYTPTPRYVNTPHPNAEAYEQAMEAFDEGDWEQALLYLEQVVQLRPGLPDVQYYIGECYLRLEDYLEALKAFDTAIRHDPEFGPAYWGRALARMGLNPEGSVLEDLDAAILHEPELVEPYILRAAYRLSRLNPNGALEDLETAEEISSISGWLFYYKAKALLELDRNEEALEAILLSNELDVTIKDAYFVLGQAYHTTGQTENALNPIQIYLQFGEEDPEAWFIVGQAYLDMGYYERSIDAMDQAIALKENLFSVYYYQGEAYLALEDYPTAIEYLETAIRVFPKWFDPKLAVGVAIFQSGDHGNGYIAINASTALAETDEDFAKLYYWRAIALEAVGEIDIAQRDWQSLLELPPDAVPESWAELASERIESGGPPTNTPSPTITQTPTVTRTSRFTATPTSTGTPEP